MSKTSKKTEIRVTVDIKPIRLAEVTPAQAQLVKRFWAKLITQVKDELNNEQKPKSQ